MEKRSFLHGRDGSVIVLRELIFYFASGVCSSPPPLHRDRPKLIVAAAVLTHCSRPPTLTSAFRRELGTAICCRNCSGYFQTSSHKTPQTSSCTVRGCPAQLLFPAHTDTWIVDEPMAGGLVCSPFHTDKTPSVSILA